MISNARGKHSSPGVYIEEIDKSYATKSLGVTTLGVVGETLKGPAFEPVRISDWSEFQDYFGGTSTEKFKGTGYPKYELPYIAKSYLQESKQLEVCRVLGFSGYNAGPAWVIYGENSDKKKYAIGILRSKAEYGGITQEDICNGSAENNDKISFNAITVKMQPYTSLSSTLAGCKITITEGTTEEEIKVSVNNYGKFNLALYDKENPTNSDEPYQVIPVSLNPGESNYIVNMLGMDAQSGKYSIFVEDLYDLAHIDACDNKVYEKISIEKIAEANTNVSDYKEQFRYASTPWFVSQMKGNGKNVDLKTLFRFHTISDGNAANSQIKISIANILPDEGLFDVLIRDYHDTDNSQVILERFNKCSMVPGTSNFIGLQIGTFNGDYAVKSKYVTVEVNENEDTESCVPCGFLGYPVRNLDGFEYLPMAYNTKAYDNYKPNKQFFGMSDLTGVDLDILTYKGFNAYHGDNRIFSDGFHLDSFINAKNSDGEKIISYTVDGVEGYSFVTPNTDLGMDLGATQPPHIASEGEMEDNIYSDKRLRKFTCYPCGGFDGWDIYRKERTNSNEYRANKYKGALNKEDNKNAAFSSAFNASDYGLTGRVINSDYYAYLAGYKQFDNPHKVKINLFATPGIDYVNNLDLFNEVLDIVEEYRKGDCLYIVTTPETGKNGEIYDADSAVANLETQEINTSYAATYYPWVKYYDSANKKYINLPVTKDVVRNFAYTDNVSHPWFASAGMSRGPVDCVKATRFTRQEEEDVLYEGLINPVKTFASDGVKIWGNKTLYQEDTPLNRINVRRLMIRVKDLVMSAAKKLIFEQNDNTVDAQFRSIVEPILANVKQNRGITDFKIKTDTSAEARDRKELPAAIYVKPINCLEFIPITFTIYPEGAEFDE